MNEKASQRLLGKVIAGMAVVASVAALSAVLAGCAPQQNAGEAVSGQAEQSTDMTVPTEFSMDSNCSVCHTDAAEGMTEAGCTGSLHVNTTCVTCHSTEAELAQAHEENFSAKGANRVVTLVNTSVSEDTCFTCHDGMDALAAATADSTVLTDNNGTVVNPHDLPADHFGEKVDCGSCHKMHSAKYDTETNAANACMSCHHDSVYECGTCHAV